MNGPMFGFDNDVQFIASEKLIGGRYSRLEYVGYAWHLRTYMVNPDGTLGGLVDDRMYPAGLTNLTDVISVDGVAFATENECKPPVVPKAHPELRHAVDVAGYARASWDRTSVGQIYLAWRRGKYGDNETVLADDLRQWLRERDAHIRKMWVNSRAGCPGMVAAGKCVEWEFVEGGFVREYCRANVAAPQAEPAALYTAKVAPPPPDPFTKWPKCHVCSEKAGKYVPVQDYKPGKPDPITGLMDVKVQCHDKKWTHTIPVYKVRNSDEPYALFAPGYDA